jgi:hypothetical protein
MTHCVSSFHEACFGVPRCSPANSVEKRAVERSSYLHQKSVQ